MRNYINGSWTSAGLGAGQIWKSHSPADQRDVLGTFVEDVDDVDAAVDAAKRAQPAWEALTGPGPVLVPDWPSASPPAARPATIW